MVPALIGRGKDRRRFPRFPLTGGLELRAKGIHVPIAAHVRDISAGGCRVDCRVSLEPKHLLQLELALPASNPIVLTASVVRSSATLAERTYHYGLRFRVESSKREALAAYITRYCRFAHDRYAERRSGGWVDARFPVTIGAPAVPSFGATVIALSSNGIRVASDRVLRQEWLLKIELALPGAEGSRPLTLSGRARPGAKTVRGTYVQDVDFLEPSLKAIGEIERAVAGIRARRSRAAS